MTFSNLGGRVILDDVLAHRAFGLESLVRNSRSARRAVLGAHVVEAVNPSRWVPPQWIVLTTGMRLWRDPAAQRALVAELSEGGVVALGFGIGIVFDAVPAALLEEARQRDFAVFAVPEETPFREIVRMVDESVFGQDLQVFRRSAAITDSLVQALGEPSPETALVALLARLLRCQSSLHRADGTVVFTSDSPPGAQWRWQRLRELELSGPPVEVVDADGLFATTVQTEGAIGHWVVLSVSRGSLAVPLILRALIMVGKLLEGLATVRGAELARRRMGRADLLTRLLELAPGADGVALDELRDRGRALGVDLDGPGQVLAVSFLDVAAESMPGAAAECARRAEQLLARMRMPYLLADVQGRLMVWLPADSRTKANHDELLEATGGAAIGVGRAVSGVTGVRTSGADACLALARAALIAGPVVVHYDELGLLEWLVLSAGVDRVARRAADVLAPLAGQEFLVETLRQYLHTSLSVPATARALHVHENSVRHRLNRVRTLLGRDLHATPTLAEIYLALLLRDLDGTARGAP